MRWTTRPRNQLGAHSAKTAKREPEHSSTSSNASTSTRMKGTKKLGGTRLKTSGSRAKLGRRLRPYWRRSWTRRRSSSSELRRLAQASETLPRRAGRRQHTPSEVGHFCVDGGFQQLSCCSS